MLVNWIRLFLQVNLLNPKYWSDVNGGAESNVANILTNDGNAKFGWNEFFWKMNFVEEIMDFKLIWLSID